MMFANCACPNQIRTMMKPAQALARSRGRRRALRRAMLSDNGVRFNDRQRITNSREQPIETNEYQSVDATEGEFLWSSPPQDVYLLPQRPNLCLKHCPRPDQIDGHPTNQSAKVLHPPTASPDSRSTVSRIRFATGTTTFYTWSAASTDFRNSERNTQS